MRKRRNGIISAIGWTIATSAWIGFGLFLLYNFGFGWLGFAIYSLVSIIPGMGLYYEIFYTQQEEITEFTIYEFESWNKEEQRYDVRYMYAIKSIMSKFVFNYHILDSEDSMSIEEVEKHINLECRQEYSTWNGYATKNDVMIRIVEIVDELIKSDKVKINPKIINVKSAESYTVDYIREKIITGELKVKK